MKQFHVAIDGPAGSGKSTISALIAKKLNWIHIDTGAMYRAVTLCALEKKLKIERVYKMIEKKEMPAYLAWLTPKVRFDRNISDKAKLIYAELCALSNAYGYAFPSNEFIAELYGINTRTVTRILKELTDNKYIKISIHKTKTGTTRRIYILENINSEITEKNPLDKNVQSIDKPTRQKCLGGIDKNVRTHQTKMSSANIINDTSINDTSINDTRECIETKNKSNLNVSADNKNSAITLSLVKNLCNELDLKDIDPEKFYYYYESRNWKFNNGNIIKKNNLKSMLFLWTKREKEFKQVEIKHKIKEPNHPDWLNEYIDEINSMEG